MKTIIGSWLLGTLLVTSACGGSSQKAATEKAAPATQNNFNAETDAAPGTIISELAFTEKQDNKEISGKRITKFFEDTAAITITDFKKAGAEVYEAVIYTINKSDAKGLKADLTPLNDGSSNLTAYNPKDFGSVSLVFVAAGNNKSTNIINARNMHVFMNEKKDNTTKENTLSMPVADFKTADEWVKKLSKSLK